MGSSQKWIPIGRILSEWGLRGQVKCFSFNPESELLSASPTLFLETPQGYSSFKVEEVSPHGKYWRIKFKGIKNPEEAKKLRRKLIVLPREFLPPLEEGEFYLEDLVGFSVVDPEGKKIGDLLTWERIGDSDVFLVGKTTASADRVPYVKDFVKETNQKEKKIKLTELAMEMINLP